MLAVSIILLQVLCNYVVCNYVVGLEPPLCKYVQLCACAIMWYRPGVPTCNYVLHADFRIPLGSGFHAGLWF